jgi:hypothetical protein
MWVVIGVMLESWNAETHTNRYSKLGNAAALPIPLWLQVVSL